MEPAITEKADCIFDALGMYAKDESTRGAFEVGDPEGNRHYRVRTAKGNITTLTVESDDLVLKNGPRLAIACFTALLYSPFDIFRAEWLIEFIQIHNSPQNGHGPRK